MNAKRIAGLVMMLLGIAIIGISVLYQFGGSPFQLTAIDQEYLIDAERITDIQVTSSTGNVRVMPYDGEDIQVRMEGTAEKRWAGDYRLAVNERSGQLTVEAAEVARTKLFSMSGGQYTVIIALPDKRFERLAVNTDVANIFVEKVQAEQMVLYASVGNIDVSEPAGQVHMETEVGDIQLHVEQIVHSIVASAQVGNITVTTKEAPQALRTEVSAAIGDQSISLPVTFDAEGPLVKLTAELGNVSLAAAP